MDQLHRRLTVEQVKVLLHGYCQGTLSRADAQDVLGVGKTRFFALLEDYRSNPSVFSITYERETHAHLSATTERTIATELRREQKLVEDPRLPISGYNFLRFVIAWNRKGSRFRQRPLRRVPNNWVATNRIPNERCMIAKSLPLRLANLCNTMCPSTCGLRLRRRNGR